MKRKIALALMAAMTLSMAACGNTAPAQETSTSTSAEAAATQTKSEENDEKTHADHSDQYLLETYASWDSPAELDEAGKAGMAAAYEQEWESYYGEELPPVALAEDTFTRDGEDYTYYVDVYTPAGEDHSFTSLMLYAKDAKGDNGYSVYLSWIPEEDTYTDFSLTVAPVEFDADEIYMDSNFEDESYVAKTQDDAEQIQVKDTDNEEEEDADAEDNKTESNKAADTKASGTTAAETDSNQAYYLADTIELADGTIRTADDLDGQLYALSFKADEPDSAMGAFGAPDFIDIYPLKDSTIGIMTYKDGSDYVSTAYCPYIIDEKSLVIDMTPTDGNVQTITFKAVDRETFLSTSDTMADYFDIFGF